MRFPGVSEGLLKVFSRVPLGFKGSERFLKGSLRFLEGFLRVSYGLLKVS